MISYLGILVLLIALYFIRKYLFKLDEYLNSKSDTSKGFIGKPWHISWSLVIGLALFITLIFSSGQSEPFKRDGLSVFIHNPHPLHWFWLLLIAIEVFMIVRVIYQSIKLFGINYGLIRSVIITLLMIGYFLAGMYMGLIFTATIALFIICKVFIMFYGRKKGLLTSNWLPW